MKIIIATESYYPNIDGGAIAQHNLAKELKKRGHQIAVIAPGHSFRNKIDNQEGITVYRPRSVKLPLYMKGRYHFSPFPFLSIRKIIKDFKPDILQVCSPYPTGICSMLWAKKYKIPVLGAIHLLPENMLTPFFNSKYYKKIEAFSWKYLVYFFNHVDWATIPTKTGANMYIEKGLKTSITPISNGIKTEIFNPDNNGQYLKSRYNLPSKDIVLTSGRITQEKNLDVLIKAIPAVVKEIDAHFLIVGSGGIYKKTLIDLAEKLNVSKNITFTDFLSWEDYPNIYSIADVFAIPSEAELQSIVTLEAVSTGLPIVVVNKGALPELVDNNGLTFEPQNSKQMAENITKILSDSKLKKTMSKNSLELVKKHSMNSVGSQYEKLFEKVIKIHKSN